MPLWVDLSWANREEHFSSYDPRFQRAIAMLAAPMHGTTLDELVGEDIRQHRITRITIGTVIGVLTLLLAVAILATVLATRTSRNLARKIALINAVMPVFGDEEDDEDLVVVPESALLRADYEAEYGALPPEPTLSTGYCLTSTWICFGKLATKNGSTGTVHPTQ